MDVRRTFLCVPEPEHHLSNLHSKWKLVKFSILNTFLIAPLPDGLLMEKPICGLGLAKSAGRSARLLTFKIQSLNRGVEGFKSVRLHGRFHSSFPRAPLQLHQQKKLCVNRWHSAWCSSFFPGLSTTSVSLTAASLAGATLTSKHFKLSMLRPMNFEAVHLLAEF